MQGGISVQLNVFSFSVQQLQEPVDEFVFAHTLGRDGEREGGRVSNFEYFSVQEEGEEGEGVQGGISVQLNAISFSVQQLQEPVDEFVFAHTPGRERGREGGRKRRKKGGKEGVVT